MPTGSHLRLRTLWLGDPDRTEFAAAAEVPARETDMVVRSITDAQRSPPTDTEPSSDASAAEAFDLIVAAESFPGELPPGVVRRLRRRHPAARWVRLVGPWCDGEVRSASPPPATLRVPWHRAATWFARQFERLRAGERSELDEPATFDEADRLPAVHRSQGSHDRPVTVAVWAEEQAAREWLFAAIAQMPQMRPVGEEPANDRGPQIAVADLATADGAAEKVATLRRRFPHAALVIVVGFPRPRDIAALYEGGATAVLSKPLYLADLETAIQAASLRLA